VNLLRRNALLRIVVLAAALSITASRSIVAQDQGEDVLLAGSPAASGGLKTVAVVALAPYESLTDDIRFLGSLAGSPESGQMLEGMLAMVANSLDRKQPLGVIINTDGSAFLPVACLPVTNPDSLLDMAKAFGAVEKKGADGVSELVLPNEKTFFTKHSDGWTFISISPAPLAKLPEKPAETLSRLITEHDVAARVSVKDVPEMYRGFAVAAMQAGMQQQMNQKADETEEEFELRRKLAEVQMEQMVRMINEMDSLSVGWAIDAQQERTYLDFSYTFVPGSVMAGQFAAYEEPRTNFAGFYQPDAAATMTFVTKADPQAIEADLAQFESMMQTVREQLQQKLDSYEGIEDAAAREAAKSAAFDLLDAFEATIKAGEIDGGAALHVGPGSLTVVAGVHVKDSLKVESGLKKLEANAAKSKNFGGVQWNAASHAGVNFHTLTLSLPEHLESPRRLLGNEAEIAIGIGDEAVYLALGRDNLEAVKKAIDASAAEPNKSVPIFELAISLGPIMETLASEASDADKKKLLEAVAQMLRNEAQGRDHIRTVGRLIPNGLSYRFEAEEGVLRAIGKAQAESQREALQALQQ
jgi:hypothetical protein